MNNITPLYAKIAFLSLGVLSGPQVAPVFCADPTKEGIVQTALDTENQKAINVYGKVVDQNGAPVGGVTVNGGVLINVGFEESGSKTYTTTTDAGGLFSFVGLNGVRLGVKMSKTGYEYSQKLYLDWWDSYKPDPQKPMVFVVYKLRGAEPMVKARLHSGLPVDGQDTHFDLLTGQKLPAKGDLIVSITRYPIDIVEGHHFEWSATIRIPDGGLIVIADPYANEAPENGYLPSVTVGMSANVKQWSDNYTGTFYFKARNGQLFGRIRIVLSAGYQPPPTYFEAEVYANPAGSRNLEYDRTKRIAVPNAVPLKNLD